MGQPLPPQPRNTGVAGTRWFLCESKYGYSNPKFSLQFGESMQQKKFDFWQDHSLDFLEMAFRSDRRAKIEHPDGYGKRNGDCGDTVEIYLCIQQGVIRSVSYEANGCLNTNACANTVVALVEGRKVEDAWEITVDDVVAHLKTLPPENTHCAELAVGALYLALADYREGRRHSWKKLYRSNMPPG